MTPKVTAYVLSFFFLLASAFAGDGNSKNRQSNSNLQPVYAREYIPAPEGGIPNSELPSPIPQRRMNPLGAPIAPGTYNVGVSQTYPTLSAAVTALQLDGVAGGGTVIFQFMDAAYADTGQTIGGYFNQSAANPVIFRPASGVTTTITFTGGSTASNSFAVRMDSASGVTWDGSNSGGLDRSLTIVCDTTGTPTSRNGFLIRKGSNNLTFKNVIVKGSRRAASNGFDIFRMDNQTFAASGGQHDILVDNCEFKEGLGGIFARGASGAVLDYSLTFTNNLLGGGAAASNLTHLAGTGVTLEGNSNVLVSGNDIYGIKVAGNPQGIRVQGANAGVTVTKNKIHNLVSLASASAFRPICILIGNIIATGPAVKTTAFIANNMIYDIHNFSTPISTSRAIDGVIYNPTGPPNTPNGNGSSVQYVNNTFDLNMLAGEATTGTSFLFDGNFAGSNTTVGQADSIVFLNNIAANRRATVSGARMYLWFGEAAAGNLAVQADHNDFYYTVTPFAQIPTPWPNGTTNIFVYSREEYRDSTRMDSASVYGDPRFVSTTDVHLNTAAGSFSPADMLAIPYAGVTTDIDGQARNVSTPDAGADEYTPTPLFSINGDLSKSQYFTIATKQNSNSGFGPNIDISKIVVYADNPNGQLYVGVAGKMDNGSNNGIGLWLGVTPDSGRAPGLPLGGSPGGHYMGGNGGANPNFKADFNVDYMLAVNPGSSSTNAYIDAVQLVGGRFSSYLGNPGQSGGSTLGPNSITDVFPKNSIESAFNNDGVANHGWEMRIPFENIGVTSLDSVEAFAVIVSSSAFFSDVTVPGNIPPSILDANPGFDADFSTLAGGPYHSNQLLILPITLSSFTGHVIQNGGAIQLDWTTISEVNNYGFFVQRKRTSETEFLTVPNSFVAGHGTTNTPHSYRFIDNSVSGGTWNYRLKQQDLDGTIHYTEPIQVNVLTGVGEVVPHEFALLQNYPNPFNPSTDIKFSVANTAHATLEVYNMLGQKVMTMFDGVAEAGQYYTLRLNASALASGTYFYKLESGASNNIKKLMLIK